MPRFWMLLVLNAAWLPGCSPPSPTIEVPAAAAVEPAVTPAAQPAQNPDSKEEAWVRVERGAPPPENLWKRSAGHDWPQFLGPGQDSKSAERGIVTAWDRGTPRIVWRRRLGTGYGAPTVARGRLFQFDRFGDRSRLYCLRAETGEELWQYEMPTSYEDLYGYNNGPRCSPVVDGDRVYAYGVDGVLACVRAADGQPVWKRDLHREFGVVQNFFGVGSTPAIDGVLILCMVGGSPPESQQVAPGQLDRVTASGSGIVALDKYTGEVQYRLADELASYASLKVTTVAERRWCFAFCRGGLVGFDPAAGKLDFHYPWRAATLESVNASMPVVVGDEVLISETYGPGSTLLRVAPGKAEVVWRDDERRRDKALQTHWMTPVFHEGYLYASSGRHPYNAELRCVEWRTGQVKWSVPELTRTSLLYVDGHFVCLGEYGELTLFKANPEKYERVAVADFSGPLPAAVGDPPGAAADGGPLLKFPCWAAPVLAHGLLYVRGDDQLVCLELIPPR